MDLLLGFYLVSCLAFLLYYYTAWEVGVRKLGLVIRF